jgi:hypothetical protein
VDEGDPDTDGTRELVADSVEDGEGKPVGGNVCDPDSVADGEGDPVGGDVCDPDSVEDAEGLSDALGEGLWLPEGLPEGSGVLDGDPDGDPDVVLVLEAVGEAAPPVLGLAGAWGTQRLAQGQATRTRGRYRGSTMIAAGRRSW